jgi:hypothetical protein
MELSPEQFEILKRYLQEALDIGSRGTATKYTASGMAYHAAEELADILEDDDTE